MQTAKSVLTQASFKPFSTIKPAPARDYDDPNAGDRRWEIVYGYGKDARKFLTDEERKHFLSELSDGKTIVQVGALTLTNRFLYMAAIKDKPKKIEYELIEIDGKQVYREVDL